MTNNRLQMLLRVGIEATKDQVVPIDDLIERLAEGLCAPEFLYDAITELRHDDQLTIIATHEAKVAMLSEKGRKILEFDRKILVRIDDIRRA